MKSVGLLLLMALILATPARAADWNYQLTPYLWASGLDGTQAIGGREFEVDASFSDLLEVLDVGFAARFEAQGPRWGWFGDIFYAKLSDDANLPAVALSGETKQTIAEAGVSYRLAERLKGLAGLRYQKSELELAASGIGARSTDESWIDGFVGLHWMPVNTGKWQAWLRGDIGAGDSDLVWFTGLGVGYRFNARFTGLLAYRYLDTDYERGGFKWDLVQSGLGLGLAINW